MILFLDTTYRSFAGEVEASSPPTICRLPDSRRHQLWAIARAIERQPVLEKLLAAKVLVIRILDPLLAHHLVAEIIGVLENREPRHQPGRQRRPPGAVGIHGTELLFQKPPVDRPRQLHQRVIHVDDLVEPRAKQILLAAFPPLPWPHRTLRQSRLRVENHSWRFEGIPNLNSQENR